MCTNARDNLRIYERNVIGQVSYARAFHRAKTARTLPVVQVRITAMMYVTVMTRLQRERTRVPKIMIIKK